MTSHHTPAQIRIIEIGDQTLQGLVSAAGLEGRVHDRLDRLPFTPEDQGSWESRCFSFDLNLPMDDVLERIGKHDPENPWQVARITHLLGFAASFPEEPQEEDCYGIVAYGSLLTGERTVPGTAAFLGRRHWEPKPNNRAIDFGCEIGFDSNYHYLAVRRKMA